MNENERKLIELIAKNECLNQMRRMLTRVSVELEDLRDGTDVVRETNDLLGENMRINTDKVEDIIRETIRSINQECNKLRKPD